MRQKSFAQVLRQARLKAGLSQAELAVKVGLTGSYISQLEAGNRRPLIPRRVEALCKALGIPSGPLQEAAALERSSPTIRKRLETVDRERAKLRRARDRLLLTVLHTVAQRDLPGERLTDIPGLDPELRRQVLVLVHRSRGLRDARRAEQESERILEGVSVRQREGLVRVLPDLVEALLDPSSHKMDVASTRGASEPQTRPYREGLDSSSRATSSRPVPQALSTSSAAFYWTLDCDDGYPRFETGDVLLLDPEADAPVGTLVVVRVGATSHVRRVGVSGDPSTLCLESLDASAPPLRLPRDASVFVVRHLARSFNRE